MKGYFRLNTTSARPIQAAICVPSIILTVTGYCNAFLLTFVTALGAEFGTKLIDKVCFYHKLMFLTLYSIVGGRADRREVI